MEIALADRGKAWRRRGAARREIPEQVKQLVDGTYRTKKVAEINGIASDRDREEARELLSLARSYAESLGRRLRVQPRVLERAPRSEAAREVTRVLFEMVDITPRRTK